MKKRFVLSGYFGFKNFGDEAILSVLVKKLQNDGHRITIISSDPQYTKKQFRHIRSVYTFKFQDIIGAIAKSNILVSGGGSLLQDVTSLKSLIYYLLIISIGLLLRKKVIIFAQGIGPIKSKIGQFLTKNILKHCNYVSVRDEKSLQLLNSWEIKADLLCDPIFSTQTDCTEKNNTLAIQLRDFKTMNDDFIDRLAQKVAQDFSDKDVEIYSFQDAIDKNICEKFEKALKMLKPEIKTTLYTGLTNDEIIQKLSKAQYLIAMRFHAIIIGLISRVKVLSINYDIKVEKISKEFGIPMVELNKEFGNQFEELKNENLDQINNIVQSKTFDWSGFNNAID